MDQLLSQQGARFLRKRNRNMIVEVPEEERIPPHDDFFWLTLGQLGQIVREANIVNMDSRTVLSCIRYTGGLPMEVTRIASLPRTPNDFSSAVLASALADEADTVNDFDSIISWMTELKSRYRLQVERIPLNKVESWRIDEWEIRHETGRYFSVKAFAVRASNREIRFWEQPLIESAKGGVVCFVCQMKQGTLHFLVQGRVEPGNLDAIEMAPTLQCTPGNYDAGRPEAYPPFYELIMQARADQIRYNALQSEEGGRFYHDQNRYLIIEIEPDARLSMPDNYCWMTLRQVKELIRFNNYFNIEARGLIACLAPAGSSSLT